MTIPRKPSFESKICHADELPEALATLARPIVFTNGVFDILHRGHASYLDQARKLGGSLVVGVNTDASVKMLGKGDDRPINAEADRQACALIFMSKAAITRSTR
jgi:cytidyltransferase-like protein